VKIIGIQALAIVISCSLCLSGFTFQVIFLLRCAICKQNTPSLPFVCAYAHTNGNEVYVLGKMGSSAGSCQSVYQLMGFFM
jgi:hypothetical protein